MIKELEIWESVLEENEEAYLANTSEMTLADCAFYPILAYISHRGFDFTGLNESNADNGLNGSNADNGLNGFTELKEYMTLMEQHESVKLACPQNWDKKGKINLFNKINNL